MAADWLPMGAHPALDPASLSHSLPVGYLAVADPARSVELLYRNGSVMLGAKLTLSISAPL